MIVYENTDHQFDATGYDTVYAADRQHFTHRATFTALEKLFDWYLRLKRPLWCLDLGCGQGQVAAKVRDIVSEKAPKLLGKSHIYGLDLSAVAIRQCDESYPDLLWIQDTLQDFLKREETRRDLFGRFDLVINKGGLTFVESEAEYDELLSGIHSLLRKGGLYLYIQNKKFYEHWANRTCKQWARDVFDIAGGQFGTPSIIDNKGYFIYIYTKGPDAVARDYRPAADEPLSIEFCFNTGQTVPWFVGGNETMALAVRTLVRELHEFEPRPFRVTGNMPPKSRAHHERLVAQTAEAARRNGSPVVVPIYDIWKPNGRRGFLTKSLHNAMYAAGLQPLHYPLNCRTTRKYCDAANEWVAARPDAILLGLGLEDYRLDAQTGETWIDLDEFAARIDWLAWKLQRDSEARIIWIWLTLDDDLTSRDGKWTFRAEDARVYQATAEQILRSAGIEPTEVRLHELLPRWGRQRRHIASRVAKIISRALQPEGATR